MKHAPLIIALTRGGHDECIHRVHALVMDGAGKIKKSYGNENFLVFPRSALKPLQNIALLETGAAQDYHVSEKEIALACASHNGEDKHIHAVGEWLSRLGKDENVLECGGHAPYMEPCKPVSILANNCSGKHAGMVTLSLHLKADPAGYTNPKHPVQQKILSTMSEMCDCALTPSVCGIDGCSAPNPILPLKNFGLGLARLMNPTSLPFARGAACKSVFQAMTAHADLVAGENRLDTLLMQAAKGKIMSKIGAEGVYIALVPEHDTLIVLKAEDGALRASQAAIFHLLEQEGLADDATLSATRNHCLPVLKNWRGLVVGDTQVIS